MNKFVVVAALRKQRLQILELEVARDAALGRARDAEHQAQCEIAAAVVRANAAEAKIGHRDEKIAAAETLAKEARTLATMIRERCGHVADDMLEALNAYERVLKP